MATGQPSNLRRPVRRLGRSVDNGNEQLDSDSDRDPGQSKLVRGLEIGKGMESAFNPHAFPDVGPHSTSKSELCRKLAGQRTRTGKRASRCFVAPSPLVTEIVATRVKLRSQASTSLNSAEFSRKNQGTCRLAPPLNPIHCLGIPLPLWDAPFVVTSPSSAHGKGFRVPQGSGLYAVQRHTRRRTAFFFEASNVALATT
jgi:hypothetical protein